MCSENMTVEWKKKVSLVDWKIHERVTLEREKRKKLGGTSRRKGFDGRNTDGR